MTVIPCLFVVEAKCVVWVEAFAVANEEMNSMQMQ